MTQKMKPRATFEICFRTHFPEEVPIRAVADAMGAVQGIIHEGMETPEPTVHLLDVVRGSAVYRCVAAEPELAVRRLRLIGGMIESKSPDCELGQVFPAVRTLSALARQAESAIIVRQRGTRQNGVLLRIEAETYETLRSTHTVTGESVLVGELKRIGGATRSRCMVRAVKQRLAVYCDIDQALARDLAPRLYQKVVLEGEAVWLRATWDIVEFKVSRIVPYRRHTFAQARELLRAAGADRWDKTPSSDLFFSAGED